MTARVCTIASNESVDGGGHHGKHSTAPPARGALHSTTVTLIAQAHHLVRLFTHRYPQHPLPSPATSSRSTTIVFDSPIASAGTGHPPNIPVWLLSFAIVTCEVACCPSTARCPVADTRSIGAWPCTAQKAYKLSI
ncbi:hypothetical protein HETIRDRAFT_174246 [Heterobasidion irregulare TC 32-1]|uniref:Uncharacterized protein n=1 Tax=Heterobasidion irregulare (strain TC 32-1) TaxID=747525 RepID=W4JUG5_HETIT|nr:uncharacterized protein HETIRDRAFT_174246 [Heterobasidion irregulare TC 32-1]ETW77109.1 hypothetical protein HETIRDRAFT_174246 [Heterobasidion irregulare TC 32-1]